MAKKQETINEPAQPTYTKEQLIGASAFIGRRDILQAVLEENKTYTIEQAGKLVDGFMNRKVN